jgi:hypothetical protein
MTEAHRPAWSVKFEYDSMKLRHHGDVSIPATDDLGENDEINAKTLTGLGEHRFATDKQGGAVTTIRNSQQAI